MCCISAHSLQAVTMPVECCSSWWLRYNSGICLLLLWSYIWLQVCNYMFYSSVRILGMYGWTEYDVLCKAVWGNGCTELTQNSLQGCDEIDSDIRVVMTTSHEEWWNNWLNIVIVRSLKGGTDTEKWNVLWTVYLSIDPNIPVGWNNIIQNVLATIHFRKAYSLNCKGRRWTNEGVCLLIWDTMSSYLLYYGGLVKDLTTLCNSHIFL